MMTIIAAGRMVAGALCKWFRPWLKPVALAHVGYLGGWRLRRSLVFREGGFVGAGLVEINCRWFRAGANLAAPFVPQPFDIMSRPFI